MVNRALRATTIVDVLVVALLVLDATAGVTSKIEFRHKILPTMDVLAQSFVTNRIPSSTRTLRHTTNLSSTF